MCKVIFSGQFTQKQWIQTIRERMTSQCDDRSQDTVKPNFIYAPALKLRLIQGIGKMSHKYRSQHPLSLSCDTFKAMGWIHKTHPGSENKLSVVRKT